ncbi:MAG: hypothetical protein AB7O67_01940 [Vicinamibacterales bacterium]
MQLVDQRGIDKLLGLGANRSAIAAEETPIHYTDLALHPVVDEADTLTLRVDNSFEPAGEVEVTLVYALGY